MAQFKPHNAPTAAHAWVTQIVIDTGERPTLQPDGPVAREDAEAMAEQIARLKV